MPLKEENRSLCASRDASVAERAALKNEVSAVDCFVDSFRVFGVVCPFFDSASSTTYYIIALMFVAMSATFV